MKEMGSESVREHQDLLNLIREHDWAEVILVGPEFGNIQHPYLWFQTSEEAAGYVSGHRPENAAILIKGSRGTRMERLLEALRS